MSNETRKEIFVHHYINPDGETVSQFEKMLKMVINIIVSERRMQEFMKKRENDKINKLIDKYDRKSLTVKKNIYYSRH